MSHTFRCVACLAILFSGAARAASDSFTFLGPDGTVWTAKPTASKLTDSSGYGDIKLTTNTDDAHFDLNSSKGKVVPNIVWFQFIGTTNKVYEARSVCSYTHNGNKITCDLHGMMCQLL